MLLTADWKMCMRSYKDYRCTSFAVLLQETLQVCSWFVSYAPSHMTVVVVIVVVVVVVVIAFVFCLTLSCSPASC